MTVASDDGWPTMAIVPMRRNKRYARVTTDDAGSAVGAPSQEQDDDDDQREASDAGTDTSEASGTERQGQGRAAITLMAVCTVTVLAALGIARAANLTLTGGGATAPQQGTLLRKDTEPAPVTANDQIRDRATIVATSFPPPPPYPLARTIDSPAEPIITADLSEEQQSQQQPPPPMPQQAAASAECAMPAGAINLRDRDPPVWCSHLADDSASCSRAYVRSEGLLRRCVVEGGRCTGADDAVPCAAPPPAPSPEPRHKDSGKEAKEAKEGKEKAKAAKVIPSAASEEVDGEDGDGEDGDGEACLCIFDVDRTLTARQGRAGSCAGSEAVRGIRDNAYGGGELVLSEAAAALDRTWCGQRCHLAIISAGDANDERDEIVRVLRDTTFGLGAAASAGAAAWVRAPQQGSPLVWGASDGGKQASVKGILAWYRARGVAVAARRVYFFDDKPSNVLGFDGSDYNAAQVSCTSRDGRDLGLCGATLAELRSPPLQGVRLCDGSCGRGRACPLAPAAAPPPPKTTPPPRAKPDHEEKAAMARCAAVAHVKAGDSTCAQRVEWLVRLQPEQSRLTAAEARLQVGSEFPEACGLCAGAPPPAPPHTPSGSGGCMERAPLVDAKAKTKAAKTAHARHDDGAPVGGHAQPTRLNYYAYRAQDKDFSHSPEHLESVDLGNLPGVLTYLHHEVVQYSRCWPNEGPGIWRKFGIDRVTRYNVTSMCTAATISVSNPGRQFDKFVNYDGGKVGSKFEGYPSVGCGRPWYGSVGDPRARFLSLPGRCSEREWEQKDAACMQADPGGECPAGVEPSGQPGCTWKATAIGFVRLNELLGIDDEEEHCRRVGTAWLEYFDRSDKGAGTCFWNGRASQRNSEERAEKLAALFEAKYPGTPDRPIPQWAC